MKMLVTPQEYFSTHDTSAVTEAQWFNAIELLYRLNLLRVELGIPFIVNSGYRPAAYNIKIGGSLRSSHIECAAVDLADPKGVLYGMMTANNNELLKKYDLYAEDRRATASWSHLSIVAPKSGNRIFMP